MPREAKVGPITVITSVYCVICNIKIPPAAEYALIDEFVHCMRHACQVLRTHEVRIEDIKLRKGKDLIQDEKERHAILHVPLKMI